MTLLVEVAALIRAAAPLDADRLAALLEQWLTACDRAEAVDALTKYNEMHVVGLGLCVLLHSNALPFYDDFRLADALGEHAPRVLTDDEAPSRMTWLQLSNTLTALQLHFSATVVWSPESGFDTDVDYAQVLMVLLKRAGFWLARQWRQTAEEAADTETLQGLVDLDKEGWRCVRPSCVVQVLDGTHALLGLTRLLMKAQVVSLHTKAAADADETDEAIRLYNHHREASIDDFYEMSMVADCMVGAVTQYKHKFQFLFHSISQVVYYHFPSYERQRQQPQAFLEAYAAPHVNLLPLLLQVNPDIPLFYEHTGAGLRSAYAAHAFSWVFMSGYVLLLDRAGEVFCAEDLRSLLLWTRRAQTDAPGL